MFFFKRSEFDETACPIYTYTVQCQSNDSLREVHLVFMPDGVRFFQNQYRNGLIDAGCILFLPISTDRDCSSAIGSSINTVFPKNGSVTREKMVRTAFGFEDDTEEFMKSDSWLAQVFLCFLSEMKYGSAFIDDPLMNKTYEVLMKSHLFRSLSRYMDYIRCRHLVSIDRNLITVRNFLDSERRWVETIVSPVSELLFHESSWFDDCAEELKKVYECDESGLNSELYEPEKCNDLLPFAKVTADIASKWCFSKYRLDGIFSICYGRYGIISRKFLSCYLISISICLIMFPIVDDCFPFDMVSSTVYKILFVFLLLLLPYLAETVNIIRRRKVSSSIYVNLFLPRLFAAIAAGWMTIGLNDIVLKRDQVGQYGFNASIRHTAQLVDGDKVSAICLGLGMTVLLLLFIYLSIRRVNPYSTARFCHRISWVLLALSYTYSVCIGSFLLLVLKGEWYYNFSSSENIYTLLLFSFIAVFVGVFIQLLFQGSNESITSGSDGMA